MFMGGWPVIKWETHYREKPPGLVGGGSTESKMMTFVPATTGGGTANGGGESLSTLANVRTGASTGACSPPWAVTSRV